MHLPVVDFPVKMHQAVAEFRHEDQFFSKGRRKASSLSSNSNGCWTTRPIRIPISRSEKSSPLANEQNR
jgi:hypothetical protein